MVEVIDFDRDRKAAPGKFTADLCLMVIDGLAKGRSARHKQWTFTHLEGSQGSANACMRYDHIRLAHRLCQRQFRDCVMPRYVKVTDIGVPGLPQDLGLGRKNAEKASYEAREADPRYIPSVTTILPSWPEASLEIAARLKESNTEPL